MAILPQHTPDLAILAPVSSYLTDEHRLLQILEVDSSGALAEDELTHELIELTPEHLTGGAWRRVHPATDEEMNR